MPLYLTAAHSSRVKKPQLKRTSSLPFTSTKRPIALQKAHSVTTLLEQNQDADADGELAQSGKVITVIKNASFDALSALKHIRESMFDSLPERAGMNSERIAEVLNFQKHLPPVVSLAHIHALRSASSKTERDIQALLSDNRLRRLRLVGRGNDVSGLKELLISTEDYKRALICSHIPEHIISSFLAALNAHPKSYSLPPATLPRAHTDHLVRAGFLISPSVHTNHSSTSIPRPASIVSPSTIHRSASGSQAAVGGEAAFEKLGGLNTFRRTQSTAAVTGTGTEHVLSIPGIASYLSLLNSARTHFLDLLRQFSKHRQAPVYLLRERWNGNVDDNTNTVSLARRERGEYSNVLPSKTKKWKALNGIRFDWVLEECLGAGLVEAFETGSVGLGVRALV